jgi:hypothetical protein
MKILALLASLVLSAVAQAQSETRFYVVVKEQPNLQTSDGEIWNLELGEAFPFIRWVSKAELAGREVDPSDKSFALLQIDDRTIVVPSENIQLVEQKDMASAAMTYRQMVQESRAFRKNNPNPPAARLSNIERIKILRQLKAADLISGIRANQDLSDEQLLELMEVLKKRREEARIRDLEEEVRRLQDEIR